MIVIANGGYRTGSTLAYNVAGCIEETNNTGIRIGGRDKKDINNIIYNYNKLNSVIKCHNWFPKKLHIPKDIKLIYTYRQNIRDCIASYILVNKQNNIDVSLTKILKMTIMQIMQVKYMKKFNHPNILVIEYSEFYNNVICLVKKINDLLYANLSVIQLEKIAQEWSIDSVKDKVKNITIDADPVSELRKNHISDFNGENGYWETIIDKEILLHVNKIINKYDHIF